MPGPDRRRVPAPAHRASLLLVTNRTPLLDDAARIDQLLRAEPVVWLSTVRPDGAPHIVPIWFSWDGGRLFIASKPEARKVRNLRERPRLMLAVGEPDEDFDVGLIEATAELPDARTCDVMPAAHLEKYRRRMAEAGMDVDEYCRTYSQPILITPTRFLPWHGRSTPRSAVPTVAAPVAAPAGLASRPSARPSAVPSSFRTRLHGALASMRYVRSGIAVAAR